MMEVRYLKEAVEDIREALEYLGDRSPSTADRFSHELSAVVAKIARHPDFGFPYGKHYRKSPLKSLPWALVYRADIKDCAVWIVIVRHDRRHPAFGMKRRLPDP
jgi:plasmid stabilization system protein ParE